MRADLLVFKSYMVMLLVIMAGLLVRGSLSWNVLLFCCEGEAPHFVVPCCSKFVCLHWLPAPCSVLAWFCGQNIHAVVPCLGTSY